MDAADRPVSDGESTTHGHISIDETTIDSKPASTHSGSGSLRSSSGWDGKLRVGKSATLANPEALEDSDYSDPDAPPVDTIEADEDLLEEEDSEVEDIDLNHLRIASIPSLRLSRFSKLKRLCLRQNGIQQIELPENIFDSLEELDLYDNLIKEISGLARCKCLRTLDISYNKIKQIRNLPANLSTLKELYLIQNRISHISNLENLTSLVTLELGGNRIRTIENLNHLTSLTELWLGKNKIVHLPSDLSLPNLRLLDLKSNRLSSSIPSLSSFPNLEELYLSHNALTSILPSSLQSNPKLRILDISNNQFTHLEHISHLTELEEFWASSNQLSDFREIERELGGAKQLETVYLEMNPLQLAAPATYRNKVRLALPQVAKVDAQYVRT